MASANPAIKKIGAFKLLLMSASQFVSLISDIGVGKKVDALLISASRLP